MSAAATCGPLQPLTDALLHLLSGQRVDDIVPGEANDESYDVTRDGDLRAPDGSHYAGSQRGAESARDKGPRSGGCIVRNTMLLVIKC